MNVRELIEHLKELPPELEVFTAADDEGNGYRRLQYIPSVSWAEFGASDQYYIESVIADEDVTNDEDDKEWDKEFSGNLEQIVIVG